MQETITRISTFKGYLQLNDSTNLFNHIIYTGDIRKLRVMLDKNIIDDLIYQSLADIANESKVLLKKYMSNYIL